MAIGVWLLYAADRLLDSRAPHGPALEPRHYFHHRHRRAFVLGIVLAALALAALLPALDPQAIRLYLIEGSFLIGYFILIHATSSAHRLPKELAVGLFFAAAVFIPTIAKAPALRSTLLLPAALFSALCSLNCLFIYAWEHEAQPGHATQAGHETPPSLKPHPATSLALRYLRQLSLSLLLAAAALAVFSHQASAARSIGLAIFTAAFFLLLLHRLRHTLAPTTLRAAADLALLTPVLLLPLR